MSIKTLFPLLFLLLATSNVRAQNQLSYLEKPKMSGIHIYQDARSKIYTLVAGSTELAPNPTLIYQLDSNARLLVAKKLEAYGKNITSSAASSQAGTIIARSVELSTGQLTANVVRLDNRLQVQWSKVVESNHITYVNAARLSALGTTFLVGNGLSAFSDRKNYSFLCKLNGNGYKLWELTDYFTGDTVAFWRLAVDEQDYTYTTGHLGKKGLLTGINASGKVQWQQSLYYRGETRLAAITAGQGFLYVLGADEGSTAEEGKVFISKITTTGQMVWTTLLSAAAHHFSAGNAAIRTTAEGTVVVSLYYHDPSYQRSWAIVHLDQLGAVTHSISCRKSGQESFPRDLFLDNNGTVAGIGTLTLAGKAAQYPLYFQGRINDLLAGQSCFAAFPISQKSIAPELAPVTLDFIDQVIINLNDFPVVTKDDACTIQQVKD